MDVVQLLNPVGNAATFEAPPRSQHTLKKRRKQQSTHFIHLLERQTLNPGMTTSSQQSGRPMDKRQSQMNSRISYRDSKKKLRDELAKTLKELEAVKQEKSFYQQELDRLRAWHEPRYQTWSHGQNVLYNIPLDTAHRNEPSGFDEQLSRMADTGLYGPPQPTLTKIGWT